MTAKRPGPKTVDNPGPLRRINLYLDEETIDTLKRFSSSISASIRILTKKVKK